MIKQERFGRLEYPLHKIDAKTPAELFKALPGLARYFQKLRPMSVPGSAEKGYEANAIGSGPDFFTKVIKYIVFVYDPESDLVNEYPEDFTLLKETAAVEAGFTRNKDGNFSKDVIDIMEFRDKQVVSWILDYLKVKKNHIWQEIRYVEEEIEALNRQRAEYLMRGEVKGDLMSQVSARVEARDNLYKRFYAEHTDLKNSTQQDLYPVSPENVFKEMNIPEEMYKMRQVRDVQKDEGFEDSDD